MRHLSSGTRVDVLCARPPHPGGGSVRGRGLREDPVLAPTESPRCGAAGPAGVSCAPRSQPSAQNNKKRHCQYRAVAPGLLRPGNGLGVGLWRGGKKSDHLTC